MAAGLIAVVAVRPDTLQPVGTFVSDMFVQEADADDGDSSIPPSTKDNQAKQGPDSKPNARRTPGPATRRTTRLARQQKQKNHQPG